MPKCPNKLKFKIVFGMSTKRLKLMNKRVFALVNLLLFKQLLFDQGVLGFIMVHNLIAGFI